jgi:hypothetical protein
MINPTPYVKYENGQGDVIKASSCANLHRIILTPFSQQLYTAGGEIKAANGELPNLIVAILPDQGGDMKTKVKQ